MKRMFLASYFTQVASLLPVFLGQEVKGKSITFIPTASNYEKAKFFIETDRKALLKLGIQIDELDIEKSSYSDCISKLDKNDFIFICGGNTFFLLQEIMKKKIDTILKQLIENGKPYISTSAGSIIMSPNIEYIELMDNPKQGSGLANYNGLCLIESYILPHYNNSPFKAVGNKIIAEYSDKIKLMPISNNQVIEINNDKVNIITK